MAVTIRCAYPLLFVLLSLIIVMPNYYY